MAKVIVTCCADCPFQKVGAEIRCRLSDLVLMGSEPGSVDVLSEHGIHPECRLLAGRIVVVLAPHVRSEVTGIVTAYVGNRVRIKDGRKGVVVAKYADAGVADVKNPPPGTAGEAWYRVMLDGHGYAMAPASALTDVLREKGGFNHNGDYEFHFGFGKDEGD